MKSKGSAAPVAAKKYRLAFEDTARAEWDALDGSVKTPLKKLLAKRLDNPHVDGDALRGPLLGCYKIKLRTQGYRLVYCVIDDLLIVLIAVGKRERDAVYKAALARARELK